MKKKILLLLSFLILFLFSSCRPASENATSAVPDNPQFSVYTDELFRMYVSTDTLTLHSYLKDPAALNLSGNAPLSGYNLSKLDSCSLLSQELDQLLKFDRASLSPKQAITYDQLKQYFETELTYSDLYLFNTSLSTTTGIQVQLPLILSEYSFAVKEDVLDYLDILKSTDCFFANVCAFEELRSSNGLFMSDASAEEILAQCRQFVSQADSGFLIHTFENKLKALTFLTESDIDNLCAENLSAIKNHLIPGYNLLISTITNLKGSSKYDGGLSNYPNGKEYFEYILSRDLGWSKSVDDYDKLLDSTISTNLSSLNKCMKKDPQFSEHYAGFSFPSLNPDEILLRLKSQMNNVFPPPANLPCSIKNIDSALEDYSSPAMYFTPQIDNVGENNIYINNACTNSESLYPTLAHEGYPGHMYELTYFISTDPDKIRYLIEPGGAVEGWATYAESWSYSQATDNSNLNQAAYLNYITIMCLYAKGDIGVNYYGWDLDSLTGFMNNFGYSDPAMIERMYNTFISDPGNYCKYTLGYLAFMTIKNKVREKRSDSFSELEFHQSILNLGPIQFDILENYLLAEA